ncbi:MAG: hypothetical protein GY795_12165 [Desulfobacterales bacterium]|nr:hypothetical protein [Desulfobacterales bacterium]
MEPIQPVQITNLLDETISIVKKWETPLGKERKGKAEKAFEALRNGQIKLDNPQALIQKLSLKDFQDHGLKLLPEIKKSMQGKESYAFYLLKSPVMLYPGRGAQYRLLESRFTFDVQQGQRLLAIQNIFPKQFWKPVLDWGGSFKLALDSNLDWGAEVDQAEAEIADLGGQLSGRLGSQNQLSGFIKVAPFEYNLGRMEIEAQFSAKTAAWRLDSKEVIRNQKNVQFVILLKIPKDIPNIKVEALVQAEPSFSWLVAQIKHVFERLPQAIQQIFERRKGLSLQAFQNWKLELPQ